MVNYAASIFILLSMVREFSDGLVLKKQPRNLIPLWILVSLSHFTSHFSTSLPLCVSHMCIVNSLYMPFCSIYSRYRCIAYVYGLLPYRRGGYYCKSICRYTCWHRCNCICIHIVLYYINILFDIAYVAIIGSNDPRHCRLTLSR